MGGGGGGSGVRFFIATGIENVSMVLLFSYTASVIGKMCVRSVIGLLSTKCICY